MLKKIVISLMIAQGIYQMSLTVKGESFWPFPSYDMFAHNLKRVVSTPRAEIIHANGVKQIFDLWKLYPVEFFKSGAITKSLIKCKDPKTQEQFVKTVIRSLGKSPWSESDEVRKSAPIGEEPVSRLLIDLFEYDFGGFIGSPVLERKTHLLWSIDVQQ